MLVIFVVFLIKVLISKGGWGRGLRYRAHRGTEPPLRTPLFIMTTHIVKTLKAIYLLAVNLTTRIIDNRVQPSIFNFIYLWSACPHGLAFRILGVFRSQRNHLLDVQSIDPVNLRISKKIMHTIIRFKTLRNF